MYHWIAQEAIHGNWLVPFYGDLIKNTVLPNWQLVGWMTFASRVNIVPPEAGAAQLIVTLGLGIVWPLVARIRGRRTRVRFAHR